MTAWDPAGNAGSDASESRFHVYDPNAAVGDGGPARLCLARPLPDPSVGSTLLRFRLTAAGRVRLEVLDLAGRAGLVPPLRPRYRALSPQSTTERPGIP